MRARACSDFARKSQGPGEQIAIEYPVEQMRIRQLCGFDRHAGDDHVQRRLESHRARQPLRASGAGQQADLDLGKSNLCVGCCYTVVCGQRHLESSTEGHRLNGCDDGLGAALNGLQGRPQRGRLCDLGSAEFTNIGTGTERAAGAGQHNRNNRRVALRTFDALCDSFARRQTQPVHGRVVQGDDGYAIARLISGGHSTSG
jgi:hypothetical protein